MLIIVLHIGHMPSCFLNRFCFIVVSRASFTIRRLSTLLNTVSSSGLYGLGLGLYFSWFSLFTSISCMSLRRIIWLLLERPQNIQLLVYPFRIVTLLKYFFAIARLPNRLFLCLLRAHFHNIPNITHPKWFFVSVQPPRLLK